MQTKEKEFFSMKYDRIFKAVVMDSNDTRIINEVLNDLLYEEVDVIEFLSTEIPVNNKNNKVNILDILVKTKDNLIINVELNTNFDAIIRKRNLVYYCSLYANTFKRGSYYNNYEVIHIDLLFDKNDNVEKDIYYVISPITNRKYSKDFKIITANIACYKKNWYDKNIKGIKNHIYLVMLDSNKEELEALSKCDELVKEVKEKMFMLNEDGKFIRTLSREEEEKMIARDRERFAKEEGVKEGEYNRSLNIATSMLKENFDISMISKITSLSEEEINELKSKINEEK